MNNYAMPMSYRTKVNSTHDDEAGGAMIVYSSLTEEIVSFRYDSILLISGRKETFPHLNWQIHNNKTIASTAEKISI